VSFAALFEGQEATWPPVSKRRAGSWCIREGCGGGKRVSSATAEGPAADGDIPEAEAAMEALGQRPLFMIRPAEETLDARLADRGYALVDPVAILSCPVGSLAETPPPPVSAFTVWDPLAIMEELWAENGIGPARRAVMARVTGPKTAILGRQNDRAAGAGFAAIHGTMCFVHAVVVGGAHRRLGTAKNMMRAAALWAADHGAETMNVLVNRENCSAVGLYSSLGMTEAGHYHYRMSVPEEPLP